MKKKKIVILSILAAILLAFTLAFTVPVASKGIYCPHPDLTRYSVLFGESEAYNMYEGPPYEPDNGSNGICWGDVSLYLI